MVRITEDLIRKRAEHNELMVSFFVRHVPSANKSVFIPALRLTHNMFIDQIVT